MIEPQQAAEVPSFRNRDAGPLCPGAMVVVARIGL